MGYGTRTHQVDIIKSLLYNLLLILVFCKLISGAPQVARNTTGISTGLSSCSEYWTPYKAESCFKLYSSKQKYSKAEEYCRSEDLTAMMLSIESSDEQAFIESFIIQNGYRADDGFWLSAAYSTKERSYKWSATGSNMSYTNWASGYPTKLERDPCLRLSPSSQKRGKWENVECRNGEYMYICKKAQVQAIAVATASGGGGSSRSAKSGKIESNEINAKLTILEANDELMKRKLNQIEALLTYMMRNVKP